MAKILTFEQSAIAQLAIAYGKAREQRRVASAEMTRLKAELSKLGCDEFGVSHRVRAKLREDRAGKVKR